MFTFDTTIHLGDLFTLIVGGLVVGKALLGIRDAVRDMANAFRFEKERTDELRTQVKEHDSLLHAHGEALIRMGFRSGDRSNI